MVPVVMLPPTSADEASKTNSIATKGLPAEMVVVAPWMRISPDVPVLLAFESIVSIVLSPSGSTITSPSKSTLSPEPPETVTSPCNRISPTVPVPSVASIPSEARKLPPKLPAPPNHT